MKMCNKCKEIKDLDCFSKDKTRVDGMNSKCKSCRKAYLNDNRSSHNKYVRKYHMKEGYGVYQASYQRGIYIGSGKITDRRIQHLSGNSGIAKSLKEKALLFGVLACGTKEDMLDLEQRYIDKIGLEKLLNCRNVVGEK